MTALRTIAFYLPQFHRIPENDAWWGEGFTEWTNVRRAQPLFAGHAQPRVPGELGYYDLDDATVAERQAALARAYGVAGFCYYFYWFNGRRLLERPLEAMLGRGTPDFPFCVCWANENWSRRWDGGDHGLLMEQRYDIDDSRRLFAAFLRLFADRRYLRVDGRPLLLVYKAQLIPELRAVTAMWREMARAMRSRSRRGTARARRPRVPDRATPRSSREGPGSAAACRRAATGARRRAGSAGRRTNAGTRRTGAGHRRDRSAAPSAARCRRRPSGGSSSRWPSTRRTGSPGCLAQASPRAAARAGGGR